MAINVGIIISDDNLANRIKEEISKVESLVNATEKLNLCCLNNLEDSINFITFEFPAYIIVDYNDSKIKFDDIIRCTNEDTWLNSAGIIVLAKKEQIDEFVKNCHIKNVIYYIDIKNCLPDLVRIFKVFLLNNQILIQKNINDMILENKSGNFILDNDPTMITVYTGILLNYLQNERYINKTQRDGLQLALTELLLNAIEHGNCEISYDEKTKYLESHPTIFGLILEKRNLPHIKNKKVYFEYLFTENELKFTIRDEGNGFDWRQRIEDLKDPMKFLDLHGKGILMAMSAVDSIVYNDKGNEVCLTAKTNQDRVKIPNGFVSQKIINYKAGDVVSRRNENSNAIYYIVNGIYEIYIEGKKIAELNASDIFLGEMSFLLNNRRVADIIAKTNGTLIEIPKNEFIKIIKKYPHYGIFLAKILAQRLEKTNNLRYT